MRPWSKPFARVAVLTASLFLLLALVNLVINTRQLGTWLPLVVLMPWMLYMGVRSLRNQNVR